jgi:glycosyltransferase involved in cell wall biosynthesis
MGFDSSLVSAQDDVAQPGRNTVTVYTTLANGKEELSYKNGEVKTVEGVEVHYFKRITKDHSHLSPALLWHLWKTVKTFDIIHVHAWWNLVTMPATIIALFRGSKVVLTPRGTLSSYSFEVNNSQLKSIFHQLIGKYFLNKTYFHCTSKKEVFDTEKILTPQRIYNLPNFVELPDESQDWINRCQDGSIENKEGVLSLIFLSRIEQKKGLELLFDVLSKLKFKWKLTIVGDGETDYVESLKLKANHLKLEKHIQWLGAVYGEKKFDLMANHDYMILPSFDENFANVVIESLYTGTPVLLTKNVGLSDYVLNHNFGYVCERSSPAMLKMLDDAKEAKAMKSFDSKLINSIILRDFEAEALSKKYLDMYQDIIKN